MKTLISALQHIDDTEMNSILFCPKKKIAFRFKENSHSTCYTHIYTAFGLFKCLAMYGWYKFKLPIDFGSTSGCDGDGDDDGGGGGWWLTVMMIARCKFRSNTRKMDSQMNKSVKRKIGPLTLFLWAQWVCLYSFTFVLRNTDCIDSWVSMAVSVCCVYTHLLLCNKIW